MHAKRYGCYTREVATLGRVVAPAVTTTREGMQQESPSPTADCNLAFLGCLFSAFAISMNMTFGTYTRKNQLNRHLQYFITLGARNPNDLAISHTWLINKYKIVIIIEMQLNRAAGELSAKSD